MFIVWMIYEHFVNIYLKYFMKKEEFTRITEGTFNKQTNTKRNI